MERIVVRVAAVLAFAWLYAETPEALATASAEDVERLERKIEGLQNEVETMKSERSQTVTSASPEGQAETAKLLDRVKVGGYGSVRFEENSADDTHTTFTFRRFVLTTDAAIAPKLRFYLELEFERFRELELERKVEVEAGGLKVKQAVEGTNQSAIELEQAWLQYDLADPVRLRIGAILIPLGRFNLNHDDNRWDLPRRSLVDRGVPALPVKAAWDELGVGFDGDVEVGKTSALSYQLYVVNGAILEPEVESILHTRDEKRDKLELEAEFSPSTGAFGNDVKDEKAVTGRVAFSPALGHELAGSVYRGRYTPDFLPSEAITAFGLDGLSTWGPLEIEAEYVHSDFGNVSRIARSFARTAGEKSASNPSETNPEFEAEIEFELDSLADTRHGYWVEPRYRFRPAWLKRSIFGRSFEDPVLSAVVRWEQVWLDGLLKEVDFSGGQVTDLTKVDRRIDRITVGGSYRPVPLVAFQLAYEFTKVNEGSLSEVANFIDSGDDKAHAVLVGATFGF